MPDKYAALAFTDMFRQKLRFWFTKEGLLRFISHHDLMRLFERALRRSGLPLKLSEGFNPRPVVSFPAALALGIESGTELLEVELTQWVSPARATAALGRELPRGVGLVEVQSVRHGEKAEVVAAEYSVRLGVVPDSLASKLRTFMDKSEAVVHRASKSGVKAVNVRSFVKAARLDGDTLAVSVRVSPAGSVRPEEVLEAVLESPLEAFAPLHIARTRLELSPPP